MAKHWIAKATEHSHGQFRAKAQKADMSTGAYANKVLKSNTASTLTKRQAALAKTLMGLRKR